MNEKYAEIRMRAEICISELTGYRNNYSEELIDEVTIKALEDKTITMFEMMVIAQEVIWEHSKVYNKAVM